MKKLVLLSGLLLAAVAVAGVAQPHLARSADTAPAGRTIVVTGDGVATTVPDRASFQFGVTANASDAKTALARDAAAATAVIAALKRAGVAASDIQTSGVSLSPQTSSDGTRIVGYGASNTADVSLPIANAGAVVDAAVGAGANGVSGPGLTVSDQSSLYREALQQAVADAQTKAQALAAAAGLQLGAVQSIEEGGAAPVPLPSMRAAIPSGTPIEPGTQDVTASVTVTYGVS
jgi:uncharacterized protein YggE